MVKCPHCKNKAVSKMVINQWLSIKVCSNCGWSLRFIRGERKAHIKPLAGQKSLF